MDHEYAFEMAASAVRFGAGVTREVGADLHALGVRRALVVTDPTVSRLAAMQTVAASLEAAGIAFDVFDRVRVEPTDESFLEAIAFARRVDGDGFVALGGGSAIDTAKAANLYSTLSTSRFPRLRQSTDRQGPAGAGAAEAADRDPDHRRHRE